MCVYVCAWRLIQTPGQSDSLFLSPSWFPALCPDDNRHPTMLVWMVNGRVYLSFCCRHLETHPTLTVRQTCFTSNNWITEKILLTKQTFRHGYKARKQTVDRTQNKTELKTESFFGRDECAEAAGLYQPLLELVLSCELLQSWKDWQDWAKSSVQWWLISGASLVWEISPKKSQLWKNEGTVVSCFFFFFCHETLC